MAKVTFSKLELIGINQAYNRDGNKIKFVTLTLKEGDEKPRTINVSMRKFWNFRIKFQFLPNMFLSISYWR